MPQRDITKSGLAAEISNSRGTRRRRSRIYLRNVLEIQAVFTGDAATVALDISPCDLQTGSNRIESTASNVWHSFSRNSPGAASPARARYCCISIMHARPYAAKRCNRSLAYASASPFSCPSVLRERERWLICRLDVGVKFEP